MANVSPLHTFTEPITRQDLWDMWATATLGTITEDDLAPGVMSIEVGSDLTEASANPDPGMLFWSKEDQLLYCYHDVVDNTGVSLWLAIGPDRFDTAVLLDEPVMGGGLLKGTVDRRVALLGSSDDTARLIGCNQAAIPGNNVQPDTSASGTWIPAGIDGLVWGVIAESTASISSVYFTVQGSQYVVRPPLSPGFIGAVDPNDLNNPPLDDVIGCGVHGNGRGNTVKFILYGAVKHEQFTF